MEKEMPQSFPTPSFDCHKRHLFDFPVTLFLIDTHFICLHIQSLNLLTYYEIKITFT
jgi:hypothetical protein